ncbi:hypothetical protein ACFL59_04145 [Planctomycetota bacterium]
MEDAELDKRSQAVAEEVAGRIGIEGARVVASSEARRSWRAGVLRTVYAREFQVLKPAGKMYVVLDQAGRPEVFEDRRALEGAPLELSEDDAWQVVVGTLNLPSNAQPAHCEPRVGDDDEVYLLFRYEEAAESIEAEIDLATSRIRRFERKPAASAGPDAEDRQ